MRRKTGALGSISKLRVNEYIYYFAKVKNPIGLRTKHGLYKKTSKKLAPAEPC